MATKHKATIETPHGPRVCFQAEVERPGSKPLVTRFGGLPLIRQKKAVIDDRLPAPATGRRKGKELISRLRAGRCESCEKQAEVQVHHVRKLSDLVKPGRPQPAWTQLMVKMRRKTLVVCLACHHRIHARQPVVKPTQ
jgi:hypothetical protein